MSAAVLSRSGTDLQGNFDPDLVLTEDLDASKVLSGIC